MTLPFPYGVALNNPTPPIRLDRREYVSIKNNSESARFIDPNTKDFVIGANGHFVGQDVVQQQVYLSLVSFFDSSAQNGLGNKLFNIRMMTPNVNNIAKDAINQALVNLTKSKTISIEGVNVAKTAPGQIMVQVQWKNLNTGASKTTNLGRG